MALAAVLNQAQTRWWEAIAEVLRGIVPIVRIFSPSISTKIESYILKSSIKEINPMGRGIEDTPTGKITTYKPNAK